MKPPRLNRFRLPLGCPARSGVDASVRFTVALAGAGLLLGVMAAACSIDNKGLADRDGGGSGGEATGGRPSTGSGGESSGGAPGSGGAPSTGSGGQFPGATGGVIGSGGDMSEPATGGAPGSGGEPGTGGSASGGGVQAGSGGRGTGGAGSGGRGTGGAATGGAATGGAATGGANTGGAPVPACNAMTCPDGCCMGTTCISNRTDQRCGTGGAQCAPCGACFQCSNAGTCTVNSDARWDLICASAVVAAKSWDPATPETPLPDPYCRLAVDDDLRGTTSTKNETLTPAWNQSVTGGTSLTTALLTTASRWTVSVYDSDGSTDDVVCSVPGKLTTADLMAGTVTYSNKQSCLSLTLKVACALN